MAAPEVRDAIQRALESELSKQGIGGKVVVREGTAELHGAGGAVIAIELGDWVDQWELLPEDMRGERAEAAAVRLAKAARREGVGAASRRRTTLPLGRIASYLLVLGAGAGTLWWLYDSGFFGAGFSGARTSAAEPPATSSAAVVNAPPEIRAKRACEAARRRIYAGASMDLDVAGWVVELWLARSAPGLETDDAVTGLLDNGPSGLEVDGEVERRSEVPPTSGIDHVILTFRGGYVQPFFQPDGRELYLSAAERAAARASATHAALYARCAHLETQDVGAWYWGHDQDAALASLWLMAGGHGERPLDLSALHQGGGALAKLKERAENLDAARRRVFRESGARAIEIELAEGQAVVIRFPLGGPTRAAQASRALAVEAGLASK